MNNAATKISINRNRVVENRIRFDRNCINLCDVSGVNDEDITFTSVASYNKRSYLLTMHSTVTDLRRGLIVQLCETTKEYVDLIEHIYADVDKENTDLNLHEYSLNHNQLIKDIYLKMQVSFNVKYYSMDLLNEVVCLIRSKNNSEAALKQLTAFNLEPAKQKAKSL